MPCAERTVRSAAWVEGFFGFVCGEAANRNPVWAVRKWRDIFSDFCKHSPHVSVGDHPGFCDWQERAACWPLEAQLCTHTASAEQQGGRSAPANPQRFERCSLCSIPRIQFFVFARLGRIVSKDHVFPTDHEIRPFLKQLKIGLMRVLMSARKKTAFLVSVAVLICGPFLTLSGVDEGSNEDGEQSSLRTADEVEAPALAESTASESEVAGRESAANLPGADGGFHAAPEPERKVTAFEADLIAALSKKDDDLRKARAEIERLRDIVRRMADANRRELTAMRYNLGCLWRRVGEPRKAEEEFLKALKLSPDDPATHYNLGILYQEDLRDQERAREHYERFLELSPQDRDAAQVRGWLMELSK